jgi:hypothetical protein
MYQEYSVLLILSHNDLELASVDGRLVRLLGSLSLTTTVNGEKMIV